MCREHARVLSLDSIHTSMLGVALVEGGTRSRLTSLFREIVH